MLLDSIISVQQNTPSQGREIISALYYDPEMNIEGGDQTHKFRDMFEIFVEQQRDLRAC